MTTPPAVFLSYRREPSWPQALGIYQALRRFNIDVFIDHEGLQSGQFDNALLQEIAARPYFVLLLYPKTLDRCRESGDMLLQEITQAIRTERIIIPLFSPDFDRGDLITFLPEDIGKTLGRFNGIKIDPYYFEAAMQKLVKFISTPATSHSSDTSLRDTQPFEIESLVAWFRMRLSKIPISFPKKMPFWWDRFLQQNIQWKMILVFFSILTSYYVGKFIDTKFYFGNLYLIASVIIGLLISLGFIVRFSGQWGGTRKPLVDVFQTTLLATIGPLLVLGIVGVITLKQLQKASEEKTLKDTEKP